MGVSCGEAGCILAFEFEPKPRPRTVRRQSAVYGLQNSVKKNPLNAGVIEEIFANQE